MPRDQLSGSSAAAWPERAGERRSRGAVGCYKQPGSGTGGVQKKRPTTHLFSRGISSLEQGLGEKHGNGSTPFFFWPRVGDLESIPSYKEATAKEMDAFA